MNRLESADAMTLPFDRWAARLFLILLSVVVLGLLAALLAPGDLPPGAVLVATIGTPFGAMVLIIAVQGLGSGKPWGRPLAMALLVILVIAGVIRFLVALPTGLMIPLDGLAAAWVLSLPRGDVGPPLQARDRRLVSGLAAVYLAATAWPAISTAMLRPGASPLAVGDDAIELRVVVDCSSARDEAGIQAAIDWNWTARDLLPGSTDGLFVAWAATDGGATPYVDIEASTWPEAAWPGLGSPASALIQPLEGSNPFGGSTTFGIDGGRGGQADGRVILILRPPDDAPHGAITINAVYAHLDRWTSQSPSAECRW